MGHLHPVYDTDPHFHIDPVSRGITHTTPEKLILIQGDHNSEVYTFDIPRYVDGHDMMLCNLVQVHYINTDGTNSMNRSTGVYEVLDMQVSPEDENVCVGSWLISKNATMFVGRLSFALRFACMNGTKVTYNWNSAVYDGVPVSTGYDHSDIVIESYGDILEQWYYELLNAGVTGVNVVDEAKDKAIAELEGALDSSLDDARNKAVVDFNKDVSDILYKYGGIAITNTEPTDASIVVWVNPTDEGGILRVRNSETGSFEALTVIKGEKGEPGDLTVNVVQETGDGESLIMSQKATTDAINEVGEYADGVRLTAEEALGKSNENASSIAGLQNQITDLYSENDSLELQLFGHQGSIETNTENIATNASDIYQNTLDIASLTTTVNNHKTASDALFARTNETLSGMQSLILTHDKGDTSLALYTRVDGGSTFPEYGIDCFWKPTNITNLRDEVRADLVTLPKQLEHVYFQVFDILFPGVQSNGDEIVALTSKVDDHIEDYDAYCKENDAKHLSYTHIHNTVVPNIADAVNELDEKMTKIEKIIVQLALIHDITKTGLLAFAENENNDTIF